MKNCETMKWDMIWNNIISFHIIFLFPLTSIATVHNPIMESMSPGSITLIGESHQRIESTRLIQDLASQFVRQNKCLILALEIDDRQQPIIDKAMAQSASVSGIDIPKVIDHLAMRKMIEHMAMLKMRSSCLKVVAIDTGLDTPHDRDEWMASRLAKLAGNVPVLALLGSLHTLKKIDWLTKTGKPQVAEILANKGMRVKSFPQRWIPAECPDNDRRYSRFVSADSPEAVTILNKSMMSLLNAKPHASAQGIVDGFILWECDSLPRDNKPHSETL